MAGFEHVVYLEISVAVPRQEHICTCVVKTPLPPCPH